ncbi:matrixin family metalloprotease [Nitrosopumilus sp.]|uniref:matrixin family metalloprotease n=1 Tax=Nitrosopumilus sp. TaxID=2024843 RepID=UPI003B5A5528
MLDKNNEEITEKMLNRASKFAWKSWTIRLNFDVRQAKSGEQPDFRVLIRTPENDERGEMDDNTIMYHYFPIMDVDHPLRGLCVINPNFYYTVNGEGVPMNLIDPENYSPGTHVRGSTIDLDGVLRHEFGHGIGLSHDPEPGNTMSTPYMILEDFLQPRDIMRGAAKYVKQNMSESDLQRWLKWLKSRSEDY